MCFSVAIVNKLPSRAPEGKTTFDFTPVKCPVGYALTSRVERLHLHRYVFGIHSMFLRKKEKKYTNALHMVATKIQGNYFKTKK